VTVTFSMRHYQEWRLGEVTVTLDGQVLSIST